MYYLVNQALDLDYWLILADGDYSHPMTVDVDEVRKILQGNPDYLEQMGNPIAPVHSL